MDTRYIKLVLYSSFIWLSACNNQVSVVPGDDAEQCDFLPPAPQPEWVAKNSSIPGYYTGVGESNARQYPKDAEKYSRQSALANLSSNIQVNVSQHLTIQINEGSEAQISRRNLESLTQSITQSSIKNTQRDGLWLDRESCRLWTRVKLPVKEVEKLQYENINKLRLSEAKKLYNLANDKSRSHDVRLEYINEAIDLISQVDFKVFPLENKKQYLSRYNVLLKKINAKATSNETLVITTSDKKLRKSLHRELAYRFTRGVKKLKHLYPANCNSMDSCIELAKKYGAKRLVWIVVDASVTDGDMGSRIGELNVNASFYDIKKNRLLSGLRNQKAKVLSFDDYIAWEQAVEKIFDKNIAVDKLRKDILRCSTQKC